MDNDGLQKLMTDECENIRSLVSQHRRHMFAMILAEDEEGEIRTSHVATDMDVYEHESEYEILTRKRQFLSAIVSIAVAELGEDFSL